MFRIRIIKRSTVLQVCIAYLLLVIVMSLFNSLKTSPNITIEKENGSTKAQYASKMGIIAKGQKTSANNNQLCGYQV